MIVRVSRPSFPSCGKAIAALAVAGLGTFALAAPAYAGTSGSGTANAQLSAGSLSVNSVGSATTITGTIATTASGDLPAVTLQDTTGSGSGWNATVGISDLTYTGSWTAVNGATALTTASSGAFTDTVDGVTYTVTTGTITAGVGTFTYTSTDSNDSSGSGTAVASTANAVGSKGLTINFGTQTLTSGSVYRIHAGTESSSVVSLNTSASGAGVSPSGLTAPTLTNNSSTLAGGGVSSSSYGTAVKFVTAAVGNGMGTAYVVTPGVSVASDNNSWAATYTAGLQYTIVSGP